MIRGFIRLEISADELIAALSEDDNEERKFIVPIEDWAVFYEKIAASDMSIEEFGDTFQMGYAALCYSYGIIIFDRRKPEIDVLKDGDFFIRAIEMFLAMQIHFSEYEGKTLKDVAHILKEAYDCYINNIGKPISERSFPAAAKRQYLINTRENLKNCGELELDIYRGFTDELCAIDDPLALECKGYGCYGGNEAYHCDWFTARDCMLRLMDVCQDAEGKAVYANTLGYIYYYGRCNDGTPEYDKAFQMFSHGAVGGIIESIYKLADMYMGGKGVPKNEQAAENIVQWMYERHYKDMLSGGGYKIADLALRMGSIARDSGDYDDALYYFTQADYAIRKRLGANEYGDKKVFNSIQEELENIRIECDYEKNSKKIVAAMPIALENAFREDYIVEIKLRELKDSLRITACRRPKPSEWEAQKIEVAFPGHGYYNLQEAVVEYASGNVEFGVASGEKTFFAETMEYDDLTGTLTFLLLDEVVATVRADMFTFKFPKIDYEEE